VGKDTPIEWCDSAANPVMGCDGCELWIPEKGIEHCYAGSLHKIRAGRPGYADQFDVPKMFPGRMAAAARWSDLTGQARPDKPWLDGMPRMIFVSDMGDALSRDVPFPYLQQEIIETARSEAGQRHLWLWLTKQPQRMAQRMAQLAAGVGEWPKNLWAGTSVTSSEQTARIKHLLRVPAAVRFVSYEPALGPVDFSAWMWPAQWHWDARFKTAQDALAARAYAEQKPQALVSSSARFIDWIIVGGESGTDARPFDIAWAGSTVQQCKAAGVPVFVKQLGMSPVELRNEPAIRLAIHKRDRKGGDMAEWPADLRVRELPEVRRG